MKKKIEGALEQIQALPNGAFWVESIHLGAVHFADSLSGNEVLRFLGKDLIVTTIEKNSLLVFSRLLDCIQQFDSSSVEIKSSVWGDIIGAFSEYFENWVKAQACLVSHNKKERKKKRLHFQKIDSLPAFCELVKEMRPLLLPSLYLPMGASLFSSKIESLVDAHLDMVSEKLHTFLFTRENKAQLLHFLLFKMHRWMCEPGSALSGKEAEEKEIDRVSAVIELLMNHFLSPAFAHMAPKRRIAAIVLQVLTSFLFMPALCSWKSSSCIVADEERLNALIDRISQDESAVHSLLIHVMGKGKPASSIPENASLVEMLVFGFKSVASEAATTTILQSVDWQETLLSSMERLRNFVFSPYFDLWAIQISAMMYRLCPLL